MIDVDLESYFNHTPTWREGVRLIQWSNIVKRMLQPGPTAAEELGILETDEKTMGRADWWRSP